MQLKSIEDLNIGDVGGYEGDRWIVTYADNEQEAGYHHKLIPVIQIRKMLGGSSVCQRLTGHSELELLRAAPSRSQNGLHHALNQLCEQRGQLANLRSAIETLEQEIAFTAYNCSNLWAALAGHSDMVIAGDRAFVIGENPGDHNVLEWEADAITQINFSIINAGN